MKEYDEEMIRRLEKEKTEEDIKNFEMQKEWLREYNQESSEDEDLSDDKEEENQVDD